MRIRSKLAGLPTYPYGVKTGTLVLGASVVVLLGMTLVSGFSVALGLPLAAALATVAILAHRPRTLAWRLAAAASALWTVEEIAWAIRRASDVNSASFLTEATYFGGSLLWLAALLLLHGRRVTRQLWLPLIPAVLGLAALMVFDVPQSLVLQFPVIDTVLVLAAIPAIEPAMRGRASAGRLLLVLAFFLRALSSATFSWLFHVIGLQGELAVILILAYCLLALAAHLELSGSPAELFATGAMLIGLQLPTAVMARLFIQAGVITSTYAILLFALIAYVQLVAMMLIVISYRRRRLVAENELKAWGSVLERVVGLVNDSENRHMALAELLEILRQRLPKLRGMVLHEDVELKVGELGGYEYPIVSEGDEVGRFYFTDQPENLNVLDAVSPFLATRLQQSREQATWVNHAMTDPLTGLLNRRGLDLRVPELLEKARAEGRPVCVVMLDLDHFKRVNDFYGHTVGDQTLKALAKILSSHMRPNDLVVRWGGEEFVIVLYDADPAAAGEVVKRIRTELRESKNPPVSWVLTVSAGVSGGSVPADRGTLDAWMVKADAALKRAKDGGRDRTEEILAAPAGD